ncbi:hypothetical protein C0991_007718 [Blastosporella zonata]|nr:hypothetical protein C0991_007718 [Blastosporella zonata]
MLDTRANDDRDELGLLRAIAVKEQSSSQCKSLFKEIQIRDAMKYGVEKPSKVIQLVLDMKVRWGSTYVMLYRAISLRPHVNMFIYELGIKEDNLEKTAKIHALKLTEKEWERAGNFCSLLSHADKAQQSFSSAHLPTLFNAIPAIEILHSAWTTRASNSKYASFKPALQAATEKLNAYYEKTADSNAHIIAMGTVS